MQKLFAQVEPGKIGLDCVSGIRYGMVSRCFQGHRRIFETFTQVAIATSHAVLIEKY